MPLAVIVKPLCCRTGLEWKAVNSLALSQFLPYHASQRLQKNIADNGNDYSNFTKTVKQIIFKEVFSSPYFFHIPFIFPLLKLVLWWMNRCTQSTDPYLISLLDLILSHLETEFGCSSTLAPVMHVTGHTKSYFVSVMDCWTGDQLISIQQSAEKCASF